MISIEPINLKRNLESGTLVDHIIRRWMPWMAILAAALCFVQDRHYDFVLDDVDQCTVNAWNKNFDLVPQFFIKDSSVQAVSTSRANYFRPVALTWFVLFQNIFHQDQVGWHSINLLFHLLTAFLMWKLLVRLIRSETIAAVACAVFVLHPVHIETVVYISGMTEQLMAAPMMGALYCHVRYREQISASRGWIYVAMLLFAMSIMSKETGIVVPIFAFTIDWIFYRKDKGGFVPALKSFLPAYLLYTAVFGIYFLMRMNITGRLPIALTPISIATWLMTVPSVLWFYIQKLIWPVPLSYMYDTDYVYSLSWNGFWLPILMLLPVIFFAIWSMFRSSARAIWTLGWIMIFVPLLPVMNFRVMAYREITHDRYLYLPSIGFALIVAYVLVATIEWIANRVRFTNSKILMTAMVSIMVIYGGSILDQMKPWENHHKLCEHMAKVAPNSYVALTFLAIDYENQGRTKDALIYYRKAVQLEPNEWRTQFALGQLLLQEGDPSGSEYALRRALVLDGRKNPKERLLFAESLMQQKKFSEAETEYRDFASILPGSGYLYVQLGKALLGQGKTKESIATFKDALVIDPENQQAKEELMKLGQRH